MEPTTSIAMTETYWLDLFSGETWDEFISDGSDVSGFRISQRRTAEKIKPGDRVLCYVVGLSRFIAVFDVKSTCVIDDSPIWASDTFPVRFKVEPLVMVPFENAIPLSELSEKLSIVRGAPQGINNYGYVFQGSLRKWPREDGDVILAELRREKEFPTKRVVDQRKLYNEDGLRQDRDCRVREGCGHRSGP